MFLLFLIDALRHDFVSKETTPFLYEISQRGSLIKLKPTLAYEARPAFFSGLYPENSNIAFRYIYSPNTSPFKLTGFIRKLPISTKYRKYAIIKISRFLCCDPLFRYHLGFREIPLSLIRFFDFGEKKYHWQPRYLVEKITLFDILRRIGKVWVLNSWPSPKYDLSYNGTLNAYAEGVRKYNSNLFFFYSTIADTDWAEHKYGPESEEMKLFLHVMDRTIETIFNDSKRRTGIEPMLLVFGDHGAVSVKKILDLEKLILNLPLKLGKDFVYFLDSVMSRFWFNSSKAQKYIETMLKEDCRKYGRILDNKDYSYYHFNVKRSIRGDILFLCNPGVLIFPNFHNRDIPEKGMHGYKPEYEDELAAGVIYIGNSFELRACEQYETVDIFPTILKMLGTEQVPNINGKSIISR